MRRRAFLLFTYIGLFCSLGFTFGCSKSTLNSKRVKVFGSVKLGNEPLRNGTITFDPQNGEPPAALSILDGKYEGMAIPGKNKITFNAFKKTTMKEEMKGMDGPGYNDPIEINILPERYNTKSDIFRDVSEAGPNEFNFELTGAK